MPGDTVHSCLEALDLKEDDLAKCVNLEAEWALVKVIKTCWWFNSDLLKILWTKISFRTFMKLTVIRAEINYI